MCKTITSIKTLEIKKRRGALLEVLENNEGKNINDSYKIKLLDEK